MIVCKFGGTSVGDAQAIRRLVEIVGLRRAESPLVVVSALSGVSNQLLALAAPGTEGDEVPGGLDALRNRHLAVIAELARGSRALDAGALEAQVEAGLREVAGILRSQPPSPARQDRVAGFGEAWSSRIVTAALQAIGLPATRVDAGPVVRTDARFTRAEPEVAGLPARARAHFGPVLEAGGIPVTQGFVGATADGRPTTLGRGGSDYTAALLGAALGARRVEIWTDVDGILSADPRLVPGARLLPVATYAEAAELAAFGARVLHPATQAPLVVAGIPCVVLNSFHPERPGTRILPHLDPGSTAATVRAITCKRGVAVVNVHSPRMLGATGFLAGIFRAFESLDLSVDVLASSEVSVSVTLDQEGPGGLDGEMRRRLEEALAPFGRVTVTLDRAIVAVVGTALRDTPGVGARVFGAVGGTNVEMVSQGASAINLTFVVQEAEAESVVLRLHRALVEAAA